MNTPFPNWRRIVPDDPSYEWSEIDPKLVATFTKVNQIIGIASPVIHTNGAGPALVTFESEFDALGICVPQTDKPNLEVGLVRKIKG